MRPKPQVAADLVATRERRAFLDLAGDIPASPGHSGGWPAVRLPVPGRLLGLVDRLKALTAGD